MGIFFKPQNLVLDFALSRSNSGRDGKALPVLDFRKAMITKPTQSDLGERASVPGVVMHGPGNKVHHLMKVLP